MNTFFRFSRRLRPAPACLAGALLVCAGTRARAATEGEPVRLDDYVVSAARTLQEARLASSAVETLRLDAFRIEQVADLGTALAAQPGVAVVDTGAAGGQSSIYMRGANSDHVLLLVDGIRMNTRSADYGSFLGGARLAGLDRLEVLRGPQSTLYGSSALGGVILMETARGQDAAAGSLAVAGGSFGTLEASLSSAGRAGALRCSGTLGVLHTDNDRPFNTFEARHASGRLEAAAGQAWVLGATLRAQRGDYEEPGSALFPGAGTAGSRNILATTYAEWTPEESFKSRLTLGWHQSDYLWNPDPVLGSAWDSRFHKRNTRRIADWQNTWKAAKGVTLVGGADAEWAHHTPQGQRFSDESRSGYLSALFEAANAFSATAGLRADHYETAGSATTWRAGASYWFERTRTKLRATLGTGFNAPSMTDRYGSEPWYGPSRSIRPEKSRGWDAGFEQELFGESLTASVTWFHNGFRDLIDYAYDAETWKYVAGNRRRAVTEGLETLLEARPFEGVVAHAAYTYLKAEDASTGLRLHRRPRHTGDAGIRYDAKGVWQIGAAVHFVAGRVDFSGAMEDYTTVRAFASLAVSTQLRLQVRAENAFDEDYSEVPGYPGLPFGVFGGVDWRF